MTKMNMQQDTMNKHNADSSMKNMKMDDMNMKDSMPAMPGIELRAKQTEITLNDKQILLGDIKADTIKTGKIRDQIILTATININQNMITSVSSRVMGRIDKLYFKNIGDYVQKGAKLYDLYSEELNNSKQEYILAIQRRKTLSNSVIDIEQLVQAGRNKLLLWGMTDTQIKELETLEKTTSLTTFYSPGSGSITMLDVKEGDYVMEGGSIVRLADLSMLWAEAQVYSSQLSQIDKAAIANVQVPDIPGMNLIGKIEFVNPELSTDTRINLIRVNISNVQKKLRPGMPAYVFLNNSEYTGITLPVNAVLRDKNGASVWLQTGKNTFVNQMVETGLENGGRIEIKSGLNPGDIVVTNGVYWLNSEYRFKKGTNPMSGMNM